MTSQSVDPALSCRRMCCVDCFCCGPDTTWSPDSELRVQDPYYLSGEDDESCGKADPSVCYDISCTGGECCGVETVMDQDPDDSHGGRCQCFGQIPGPTLPPTIASSTSPPTFGAGSVQLIITSLTSPPTFGAGPVTEPSSEPSHEQCIDLDGPSCILVDKRRRIFKAKLIAGTPSGGIFEWTAAPSANINMFGGGLTLLVEGVKVSKDANDTSLTVKYTTPDGENCTDSVAFTVVGYEARFRDGSKEE